MDVEPAMPRFVDPDPHAIEIHERYGEIAFASERGGSLNIYAFTAEGLEQLTRGPGDKLGPAWSPNGDRIAYTAWSAGRTNIHVLRLSDGTTTRLAPLRADEGHPTWGPDGEWLAFTSTGGGTKIQAANPGTGEVVTLVSDPTGSAFYPSWSADGTTLYYTLDVLNGSESGDIYAVEIRATSGGAPTTVGEPELVVGGRAGQYWPAPSPRGDLLAYVEEDQIHVLDLQTGQTSQLTNGPGLRSKPAWSPDQQQILFSSDEDGDNDIYVVDIDGSHPQNLTGSPAGDVTPAWHHLAPA